MTKKEANALISRFLYDDDGVKTGVIIKAKNFKHVVERIEDLMDIKDVIRIKAEKQKTYTFEEVERRRKKK